jgi:SWIM zinc finger
LALTVEQVLALAPDPAAAQAARKLASSRAWSSLGESDAAVWGECQGSALYQVCAAREDLDSKCTCPSRKFPCKHALALLLRSVEQPIPGGAEPDWVREWLEKRASLAATQSARKARSAAPVDPEAQAKRAEKRLERVRSGIEMLDLWAEDLVRDGIASLEERPPAFFGQMAARLVDAQATGLARRVRRIGFLAGSDPGWPRAVLEELGLVALASHAFRRVDDLDAPLRADLRQLVGFNVDKEDVIASGDRVDDDWVVVGQTVSEDERFRSQRTWLRGLRTGRTALVLQFAPGSAPFEETLVPGSTIAATLAFWPGAFPQRALLYERRDGAHTAVTRLPGFDDVAAFLDSAAAAYARQPFLERLCCTIRDVMPFCEEKHFIRDRAGSTLPLAGFDNWMLLAVSGGGPVDIAGEWNGRVLFPLSVAAEGSFHPLRGEE